MSADVLLGPRYGPLCRVCSIALVYTFLAACAPSITLQQFDTAQGYRKTLRTNISTNGANIVSSEVLVKRKDHVIGHVITKFVPELVPLPGTEMLSRGQKSTVGITVRYFSLFGNRIESSAFSTSVLASGPASYSVSSTRECIEVGQRGLVRVTLRPKPFYDRVPFSMNVTPPNSCIRIVPPGPGRINEFALKAVCTGDFLISSAPANRPLILSSRPSVSLKVANAVVPPNSISYTKGPIVDETSEDGTTTFKIQLVTLTWSKVLGADQYAAVIIEKSSGKKAQQYLFDASHLSYQAKIAPGILYSWMVRSNVTGCAGIPQWSDFSSPGDIDLR
jgi:hypothetical protein